MDTGVFFFWDCELIWIFRCTSPWNPPCYQMLTRIYDFFFSIFLELGRCWLLLLLLLRINLWMMMIIIIITTVFIHSSAYFIRVHLEWAQRILLSMRRTHYNLTSDASCISPPLYGLGTNLSQWILSIQGRKSCICFKYRKLFFFFFPNSTIYIENSSGHGIR